MTVGLLHPGRMGAAIGACLTKNGHTVVWNPEGRSADTAARAAEAGLHPTSLTELLTADIVLSICPAEAAEHNAELVAGYHYTGIYIDANAISPMRMSRIHDLVAGSGATVLDAVISGPPPHDNAHPRLYIAGNPTATQNVADLLSSSGLDNTIQDTTIGSVSALKMILASYLRSGRLLAALAHALADDHGVTDALIREAHHLGAAALADRDYLPSVAARAWRWEHEMHDIADTLHQSGLPTDLADASADLYHLLAPFKNNWTNTPEDVMEQFRRPAPQSAEPEE